jgi:hypothetical protein
MKEGKQGPRATVNDPAPGTGRDGAIDFAVKTASADPAELREHGWFAAILGSAAIALWGDLPQPVQEQLFERAVVLGQRDERDEMLREPLARFLHDHHRRTLAGENRGILTRYGRARVNCRKSP